MQNDTQSTLLLAQTIAAMDGDRFAPTLSVWLQGLIESDSITMLAYFKDRVPDVFYSQAKNHRVHAHLGSGYLKGAYLLDPFHQLHVERAAPDAYWLQDIAPDKFLRGEYFSTYYAQTTLIDEIAFVASPAEDVTVTLCLGRDSSSKRQFSKQDFNIAKRIAPICTALSQRHWSHLRSGPTQYAQSVVERLQSNVRKNLDIALSPRQSEVAFLILKGHSSGAIALRLGRSLGTVKVFRKQLYKKCQISSQAELFSLLLPHLE